MIHVLSVDLKVLYSHAYEKIQSHFDVVPQRLDGAAVAWHCAHSDCPEDPRPRPDGVMYYYLNRQMSWIHYHCDLALKLVVLTHARKLNDQMEIAY